MNEIEKIKNDINKLNIKKREAVRNQEYEKAGNARIEELRLKKCLEKIQKRIKIIDDVIDG